MATIQAIDKMSKSSGLSKAPKMKALKTDNSPSHKDSSTREGSGLKKTKIKRISLIRLIVSLNINFKHSFILGLKCSKLINHHLLGILSITYKTQTLVSCMTVISTLASLNFQQEYNMRDQLDLILILSLLSRTLGIDCQP